MTPGSVLLQRGFFLLAVILVLLARTAIASASRAAGDGPDVTRTLTRRFSAWALAWIGIVLAVSVAGVFARWEARPPALPFLAAAIIVLGVVFSRSTFGDRLARSLPLAYLVLFQSFRFPLELLMHRAYTEGVMPVQMSYSGRNFDIVTGVTGLVLGLAMLKWRVPRAVVWVWNAMGLLLLINIVGVALLSAPMFQFFGPDRLNTFVAYPPYVLLPAVMVLAAWAGHLVVFRALSLQSTSTPDPRRTP
jgi:hypothetical protein